MSGQGKYDDFLLILLFAFHGLVYHTFDRMRSFRSRYDAFCLSEYSCCFKYLSLMVCHRAHVPLIDEVTEQRTLTVMSQSSCVNWRVLVCVAKGVHLHERSVYSILAM